MTSACRIKDEILRDVLGKDVDEQTAARQRAEKQRREKHAHRMISPKQRDGDPGKAVLRREALIIPIPIAKHFIDRDHSRQTAGNRHRENDLLLDGDAAIFGGAADSRRSRGFRIPTSFATERHTRAAQATSASRNATFSGMRSGMPGMICPRRGMCAAAPIGARFENRIALLL